MKYNCINIQGNLISEDILHKIEQGEAVGQLPRDFGLDTITSLRNEMEYTWSRIKLDWKHFSERSQNLPPSDPYGTSLTRRWMDNFFDALNFNLVQQKASLQGGNDQMYVISHVAENFDDLPVHIVGFYDPANPEKNTIDIRSSGGTSRLSPHATVQEYLNVTEHLYGMAANGNYLRLMRDSGRMIKLTYLEFDLKRMIEEDKYSEFTLLFRLIHSTRFPKTRQETENCLLEKYYNENIDSGNRIRDGLSKAVQKSLEALGKGFLQTSSNEVLRNRLKTGSLTTLDFYRQLRRLIYRLLFLMVAEERDLIYPAQEKDPGIRRKKKIYLDHYSISKLRKLSRYKYLYESRFHDIWLGLLQTFTLFSEEAKGKKLGIEPLGGDLFYYRAIEDLENCQLSNDLLLECIRNLNEFEDADGNLVTVNYRSLDVEEFGSVYEGLLDLHPIIENLEGSIPTHIQFLFHEGTERKTTASYYTRPDLVNEIMKSAVIPVIQERLKQHQRIEEKAKALLGLKVCDPAAGSGHFLLASARTIAWHLAQVTSGEDNPSPEIYRSSLREVIQHCIYGVDLNPDAVELCKLALWIESHNSGKPLSFLDHKIRCGNSLVGVIDLSVLQKGIPDEAFDPVTGDDKIVARQIKSENAKFLSFLTGKKDRGFQQSLDFGVQTESQQFAKSYQEVENIRQDSIEAVQKIKQHFKRLRSDPTWSRNWHACNIWTAAFFYTFTADSRHAAPTSEHLNRYMTNPGAVYGPVVGHTEALYVKYHFFHWPLEFPDVFEKGGFDVMVGNPPWEKLQAEEEEFFKSKNDIIAKDKNAERRKENIEKLIETNLELYNAWNQYKNSTLRISKFIIQSKRFPYSAKGNLNLYKIFVELVRNNISNSGRGGLVVQSGLFTDELSKELFENLMLSGNIISVYDFVNTNKIFNIHGQMRFSLITYSKSRIREKSVFKFYLKSPEEISRKEESVRMDYKDIRLINPNTFVCPQISSKVVFDLLKGLYNKKLIIRSDEPLNSFGVGFWGEMFNMTRAQKYLHSEIDIDNNQYAPLYEAKYFHQFDHRFATFEGKSDEECMKGNTEYISDYEKAELKLPFFRYFIYRDEIFSKCEKYKLKKEWLLCVRSVTSATNERTVISAIIPKLGVGNSANIALINEPLKAAHLIATFNTLITDFIAQTKVGNQNFNIYIIEQLPVLAFNLTIISSNIIEKVVELTYTSWDIKSFADDVWKEADDELRAHIQQQWEENRTATGGHTWSPPEWCEIDPEGCPLPPFKWDEDRRAVLKAELDAIYTRLYSLNRKQLRYILDPADLTPKELEDILDPWEEVTNPVDREGYANRAAQSTFPGETFRVLKEKEIRQFGEYRTRRLVLEAWERMKKEN